jgi:hypothetical protein
MHRVEARDVAEARAVERDDLAQERRVVDEAGDGVAGRGGVRRDAVVPVRAVDGPVVVLGAVGRIPRRGLAAPPACTGVAAEPPARVTS